MQKYHKNDRKSSTTEREREIYKTAKKKKKTKVHGVSQSREWARISAYTYLLH